MFVHSLSTKISIKNILVRLEKANPYCMFTEFSWFSVSK